MDEGSAWGLGAAFRSLLDRGDAWLSHALGEPFAQVPLLNRLFGHARFTARGLSLACAAVLVLCVVPPCAEWLLRRWRCVAQNFRGESIPQSFGVAILVCAYALLALDVVQSPRHAIDRLLWGFCIAAFGGLGFLDDLLGDKTVKGLRGHLKALVRDRRVTTGLVKAAGGLIAALCIGLWLYDGQPLRAALAGSVIALSANAMNLLDLRPGRACGAFCAGALVLLGFTWRQSGGQAAPGLVFVALPTLAVWPRDAQARVMLGDTGSNLLGASLGLAVCSLCGTAAQVAVLAGLILLHLVAERVSLTKVIEDNQFLRAIDRLTGVR